MGAVSLEWVANSGVLEQRAMPEVKKVLFCGEAMPNRQLNIWRRCHPDALYANLYGPTEITDATLVRQRSAQEIYYQIPLRLSILKFIFFKFILCSLGEAFRAIMPVQFESAEELRTWFGA